MSTVSRRNLFVLSVAALGLIACSGGVKEAAVKDEGTYYLVRHAEKVLDRKDPPLTAVGKQRAEDLAERLADVKLTAIYSTDTLRTRDTAAPTAKAKNLPVTLYDGGDLPGFAAQLLKESGHILVVGHSNTTPDLSGHLGGETGEPIVEATEYDRFYVVKRAGETVSSKIERFGK